MLFQSGLTGLTGFLGTFRSVSFLVFYWLIRKYGKFSLVYSSCLRNKAKLACDLQSLCNVILHVLFSAAVIHLVPVHWFLGGGGGQIVHINDGKGKLVLFSTKDNVLLISHPSYSSTINLFSCSNFPFYFYFPSTASTLHRFHIDPASTFCINTIYL